MCTLLLGGVVEFDRIDYRLQLFIFIFNLYLLFFIFL